MRYLYAILGLLAITSNPAQAQIGFGPEVGLNLSNYSVKTHGVKIDPSMKVGGMIGGVVDIQLTNDLYLQPAILYVNNGYKLDFLSGTQLFMLYNLELPVMLNYKFANPGCNRFFIGAGPYVAYNWDGAMRVKVDAAHVNSRSDIPFGDGVGDSMTRWDVGPRINGGYQLAEGLYVRVHAQMGMLNLRPEHYGENSKLTNYNFGVSIGYMLGGGKNREKPVKVKVSTQPAPQPASDTTNQQGTAPAPAPNNMPRMIEVNPANR